MLIAFLLAALVVDVVSDCAVGDKLYHENDEWTFMKRFIARCIRKDYGEYEMLIVACNTPVGRIEVGDVRYTTTTMYKCERKDTRSASYTSQAFDHY